MISWVLSAYIIYIRIKIRNFGNNITENFFKRCIMMYNKVEKHKGGENYVSN